MDGLIVTDLHTGYRKKKIIAKKKNPGPFGPGLSL